MTALLTLDNLSVSAGSKVLIQGLSCSLEKGERLGLIGESGSGKSLTALAATGLLPAGLSANGSAILAGTEVIGAPERQLNTLRGTAVAIVFQEPLTALDPLMRVGKQVAEPLARRAKRDGTPLHGDALDQAVLARGVAPFQHDDRARAARRHGLLHPHQPQLERFFLGGVIGHECSCL